MAIALAGFALAPGSVHGPDHWLRVRENGLRLAQLTGADPVVVTWFAILHDHCRRNDERDLWHGPRAARRIAGLQLGLSARQKTLLIAACAGHTIAIRSADPTLGTCWDADRLDIGRVGAAVKPEFLSTLAARNPDIIAWAQERSGLSEQVDHDLA